MFQIVWSRMWPLSTCGWNEATTAARDSFAYRSGQHGSPCQFHSPSEWQPVANDPAGPKSPVSILALNPFMSPALERYSSFFHTSHESYATYVSSLPTASTTRG